MDKFFFQIFQGNAFENVCKMIDSLLRTQCVESYVLENKTFIDDN